MQEIGAALAPNHAEGVYIIRSLPAVYHQTEGLDIIKPQGDARYPRDEIQGRLAALDDMHRTSRGDDMPSLRDPQSSSSSLRGTPTRLG